MREQILSMDVKSFGAYFDYALLKPHAINADFEAFCNKGIKCQVKMLAVNPAAVVFCKERVRDHGINVGAAVGFPFGQTTIETKKFESIDAIGKGANEIDYVINIAELKNKNYVYVSEEMKAIVFVCKEMGAVSKVIFENCFLTDEEKKILCEIASRVQPDFIKTSTGFAMGGATAEDIRLMRKYTDPGVKIKASGYIKSFDAAATMIEAGAERIGTSSAAAIIEEFMSLKR